MNLFTDPSFYIRLAYCTYLTKEQTWACATITIASTSVGGEWERYTYKESEGGKDWEIEKYIPHRFSTWKETQLRFHIMSTSSAVVRHRSFARERRERRSRKRRIFYVFSCLFDSHKGFFLSWPPSFFHSSFFFTTCQLVGVPSWICTHDGIRRNDQYSIVLDVSFPSFLPHKKISNNKRKQSKQNPASAR